MEVCGVFANRSPEPVQILCLGKATFFLCRTGVNLLRGQKLGLTEDGVWADVIEKT